MSVSVGVLYQMFFWIPQYYSSRDVSWVTLTSSQWSLLMTVTCLHAMAFCSRLDLKCYCFIMFQCLWLSGLSTIHLSLLYAWLPLITAKEQFYCLWQTSLSGHLLFGCFSASGISLTLCLWSLSPGVWGVPVSALLQCPPTRGHSAPQCCGHPPGSAG